MVTKRGWAASFAALLLLGCSDEEEGAIASSQLGDEVEREGWVDIAHPLAGDGATRFDSFPRSGQMGEYTGQRWTPYFNEQLGFDAGPLTSVFAGHLLSLSRFRGLVSTRLTGPDAPEVAASVPLGGLPVGLWVSDGVAAVIVVDPQKPGCLLGDCVPQQTSRVVLVDVQDPASPGALGEQRFDGTVLAARQVGGALHVLSQDIGPCDATCEVIPTSNLTWRSFDRSAARQLPAPRVVPLSNAAFFGGDRLFSLAEGATFDATLLRVAELSQPEPALSAPVTLAGRVRQARASGDRLRVVYERGLLDIETLALDAAAPVSLGRATLAAPDGDDFFRLTFDGDRAITMLEQSRRLALLDLSDAAAPRVASLLGLELSESDLTLAGDRALVVGRSTLAADAPPEDVLPYGRQALVLVDIADLAAPRVLDRVTFGSFGTVHDGAPELRDGRAFVTLHESPRSRSPLDPCGRDNRRLVAHDIGAGALAPAFAWLDADARVEIVGDEGWLASDVSVSRYGMSSGAATARADLTRQVDRLQPLSSSVALFGTDLATNAHTVELAPPAAPDAAAPIDVASAAGLSRVGCDERRRWFSPLAERNGNLFALRDHLAADAGAASATLHVLPSGATAPSSPRSLELEPLAAGESYLGALQTERALLIARGGSLYASVRTASADATWNEPPWSIEYGDREDVGATLSYDVVDLSDPSAPVLASRLDIDPALATGGFFRSLRGLTHDSAAGFLVDGSIGGPSVVSGPLLAGDHSEPASNGRHHFYLDRFDFADPSAPVALDPIQIPGSVLDFDAATGGLITLEALLFREPRESPLCDGALLLADDPPGLCRVQRRALSGLIVDGERATRIGRLLIDTEQREALRFAVSNGIVYYVTQPMGLTGERVGPFAAREITLQRVRLRDGRFERLPSFDIAGSSNLSPKLWTQFAARGDRALWVSGGQLLVADFRGSEPRLEVHDLGPWGCAALALRDDTAYCAQGTAGYIAVTLGEP
jgi:hypothetical protein